MNKTVTTATTKGIVIGLILVVIMLATYFLSLQENTALQYAGYLVFLGGIIWSVIYYGSQINHNSTFGGYFGHGFKVAAVTTAIMLISTIIVLVAFPEFKEQAIEAARKKMAEDPKLTEDQINQALELSRKFFYPFAIGGTLIGYMLFGAIAALIGAGVTKKNPNPYEEETLIES